MKTGNSNSMKRLRRLEFVRNKTQREFLSGLLNGHVETRNYACCCISNRWVARNLKVEYEHEGFSGQAADGFHSKFGSPPRRHMIDTVAILCVIG